MRNLKHKTQMHLRNFPNLSVSLILSVTSMSAAANAQTNQKDQPNSKAKIAHAGDLGLEEYKQTKNINLEVSQSKLFKIGSYIARTSIGNPSIAEPVVVCENQFVLLGRAPGTTTFVLWSDDSQVAVMKVTVIKKQTTPSSNMGTGIRALRSSNPPAALALRECNVSTKMEGEVQQFLSSWHTRNQLLLKKKAPPAVSLNEPGYVLSVGGTEGTAIQIKLGSKEEFNKSILNKPKSTKNIDITSAQTRTFRTRNKIAKATLIKPLIAEPVIVSGREFVVVGKAQGQATLILQDVKNNSETIDLNCFQQSQAEAAKGPHPEQSRKSVQPIPFVADAPMNLTEKGVSEDIILPIAQPKCFYSKNEIVRAAICDSAIADLYFSDSQHIVFAGIAPGKTTVHLWDDKGNSTGINLTVANAAKLGSGVSHPASASPDAQRPSSDDTSRPAEIEYWTGSKKDVLTVTRGKSAK